MNTARLLYHLARADFLERARRYSFLIMLGLVVFLGYQAAVGNLSVQVGNYRGEYNSAWVGSMMALIASFFLGWLGFYLVKGSVGRDRATGVGQIMAATPLKRPLYTFGKWLSNFAVLLSMLVILAIVGVAIQVFAAESEGIELGALLAPFVFIALPMLALTSAMAVLFETIGFLSGGFGNVIYFFLFLMLFPVFGETLSETNPAIEPVGFALLERSMGAAAAVAYPGYDGGFTLGSTDAPILGIFQWSGIAWTSDILLRRLLIFGIGVAVSLLASVFFDRFDSTRTPRRMKKALSPAKPEMVPVKAATAQAVRLTPLVATHGSTFVRILISELKLLLKGQRWWWYLVAAGLMIASLAGKAQDVRAFVLPIAWLWPVLIWSGMGSREVLHNTQQMVFSSAAPLRRQLPGSWLAGFLVAVVAGSGAALKLLSAGDGAGLLAWGSAALFIPSLALVLGVWSNGRKLFEVLYISLWYLAMNKLAAVDFLGASSDGNVSFFIPASILLIAFAFIGRARQLQN
ncbi:MAG TPA: ABC transporter permease subunit [Anaerolineales bacterium]|nr:ABC transporter permease subunit [Anaerolineales bacterium]